MHLKAFVVMMACVAAAGCQGFNLFGGGDKSGGAGPVGPGGDKGAVELVIQYPEGQPVRQMVEISGQPTVLDVTKRAATVKTEFLPDGSQRIVSIGSHANDLSNAKLWIYEVNGVTQSAAPNLRYLGNGDVVRWKFR